MVLVLVNVLGLLLMGLDKWKAKHRRWRIPEWVLLLVTVVGGSVGVLAGMFLFRHKTQHRKFTVGVPLILMVQIAVACYVWFEL